MGSYSMYSFLGVCVASFTKYDFEVYPCCRLYLRNNLLLFTTEVFYCKKQKSDWVVT